MRNVQLPKPHVSTRTPSGAQRSVFSPAKSPTPYEFVQRASSCACGGGCPRCQSESHSPNVQTKLAISTPGDEYEQEADELAGQVMRMPDPMVQRQCKGCSDALAPSPSDEEDEPQIQRQANGEGGTGEVASDFTSRLGAGAPLDTASRAYFEPRFGHDFGNVRIHDGPQADRAAASVQARAFTVGRDVVFAAGEHDPGSEGGKRLLAHELTHVVQQRAFSGSFSAAPIRIAPTDDAYEREAELLSSRPGLAPSLRLQRVPAGAVCFDPSVARPVNPLPCNPREPELCETYEMWLDSFRNVGTFTATDTTAGGTATDFDVLGSGAASHSATPPAGTAAPLARGGPDVADHFIDHPTDDWVRACLPDNLRATAYLLRSDCADIAVILRHVWLSAHHRTENFGTWTIGDRAGGARSANVATVIGEVYTGNVASMVNPYSDSAGNRLLSWTLLQNLIHPGDILVWEHHSGGLGTARTGGHTMTIVSIERDATGVITSLHVLQGNQPIFLPQAQKIRVAVGAGAPSESVLRDAPGRRIEADVMTAGSLRDLQVSRGGAHPRDVWTWSDGNTTLVAAGPARAASRPAAAGATRQISDWLPSIRAAGNDRLQPALEMALMEVRSTIEGGGAVTDADAEAITTAAGARLWALARLTGGSGASVPSLQELEAAIHALGVSSAQPAHHTEVVRIFDLMEQAFVRSFLNAVRTTIEGGGTVTNAVAEAISAAVGQQLWHAAQTAQGLGEESHFRPQQQMQTLMQAVAAANPTGAHQAEVTRIFGLIQDAFLRADRGMTTLDFTRPPAATGMRTVNVLLTAFDPFNVTTGGAPRSGEWNPSEAAVIDLDRSTVPAGTGRQAAVEGVVLPVDFTAFSSGMVESLVRAHVGVGAQSAESIITISEDPNIPAGSPVRLERFAVGVHDQAGTLQAVPPDTAGGGPTGAAIIEATAPVTAVSAAAPTDIGNDITFQFSSIQVANNALTALGLTANATSSTVAIDDISAIRSIVASMTRAANGTDIIFTAGGNTFTATVVSGPGGNFLSNEVSFRVLRQLAAATATAGIPSMHVHTQTGSIIPTGTARGAALAAANTVKTALIATLIRIIAAVAARVP